MTALLEAARLGGCIVYDTAIVEKPGLIDPLIRPAVLRINESDWVGTAESCQGHPDSVESEPWAGNTEPMLRLVCRAEDTGRMWAALTTAMAYDPEREQPDSRERNHGLGHLRAYVMPRGLSLNDGHERTGWTEVLIYLPGGTAYQRDRSIETWQRFAEEVARQPLEYVPPPARPNGTHWHEGNV